MRGIWTLFIDQYGNKFSAKTVKELREKIGGGRVSKMYIDANGKTYQTGYVIGQHWLTAYRSFTTPA
jgi:hypothetical protein